QALDPLPDLAVAYRIAMGSDRLDTLVVFPRQLVLALVGLMLGEAVNELPPDRVLTPVEDSLWDYLIQNLLAAASDAWPGDEKLTLELRQAEAAPKRARIFAADEHVVQCRFVLRAPFGEQEWYWLVPLRGVLDQFARATPAASVTQETGLRRRLEAAVC